MTLKLKFATAFVFIHAISIIFQSSNLAAQQYRLDEGDVLAIVVDGILGDFKSAPIHMPKKGSDLLAGIGYPVVVRNGGVVKLPQAKPISVRGLTIAQAEKTISNYYVEKKLLVKKHQVSVNLLKKRTLRVTVVHPKDRITGGRKVSVVDINAENATTLTALSKANAPFEIGKVRTKSGHSRNRIAGQSIGSLQSKISNNTIVVSEGNPRNFFYAAGELGYGRYEFSERGMTLIQALGLTGGLRNGPVGFGPSELLIVRKKNGAWQNIRYDINKVLNSTATDLVQPGDTLVVKYRPAEKLGNVIFRTITAAGLLFPR